MSTAFDFEYLSVESTDGILHVRLDRPERLNAFAGTVRDDLRRVIEHADDNPDVGCLVLSGEGRAFCAGGDVDVMHGIRRDDDIDAFAAILDAANAGAAALRACRVPTLALVHGAAAGGGANLALGCDVRWGSSKAAFTQSFIHLGLAPDWGGSRLLVEAVGVGRARELLLTGRTVRADEALTVGLLHRIVDDEELLPKGLELARTLAGRSATAVEALDALLASAAEDAPFEDQLELERRWQLTCFQSDEAQAAFAAFLARRKR
jgi:2-(1,2-epoxy-1,2-dihydrophenyl)acetyl-CoA isomerase